MSRGGNSLYRYQIVDFVNETMSDGRKSIECIPSSWISFDPVIGSCMAHFMPPPYDEETMSLLNGLIKKNVKAPEDWPLYECALIGHAKTYSDGLTRVTKLQQDNFAYTTENDEHAQVKAKKDTAAYKAASSKNLKEIMSLDDLPPSPLSAKSSDENYSSDTEYNSSSEERTTEQKNREKGKTKKTKLQAKKRKKSNSPRVVSSYKKPIRRLLSIHATEIKTQKLNEIPSSSMTECWRNPFDNIPQLTKMTQKTVNEGDRALGSSMTSQPLIEERNKARSLDVDDLHRARETDFEETNAEKIHFSKETKLLYTAINRLTLIVKNQTEAIQGLRNSLERCMRLKINKMTIQKFTEKHDFQTLGNSIEFLAFDQRLKDDEEFRKDFSSTLESLLDSEIKSTLIGIVKKFFTKDLAMNCTVVRVSRVASTKYVLKGSAFYENVLDFIRMYFNGPQDTVLSDKTFYQSLSTCLSNAKDWEGGRNMRRPQPQGIGST